ncbi:MAG: Methionine synthase, vitamin-B12 independent [Microvirga sp.]|nr:Methionine synthase, vitamin-B12 independent [Microvirga sp.]
MLITSVDRILTTHTGSLPRPSSLVSLYTRRWRGEEVDRAELLAAGKAAVRSVVAKQMESGIDIANNGEQQREAFFLHMRERMSGFGGRWKRPPRADIEKYPAYKQLMERQASIREAVSVHQPPKVVGEVRYVDPSAAELEPRDFRETLQELNVGFVSTFLTAPSPGIIATAVKNEHYDNEESYLTALAEALSVEYEAIVRNGFLLQVDCPDLALERHITFSAQPERVFVDFVDRVIASINYALRNIPRSQVRLHVCWGNYEGPHDCDVPLEVIWPSIKQARVGGFVLPFANPRHAHEIRVLKEDPMEDDQFVVAGVIDTLTNVVEHPEVVADRLERVAQAMGDPGRVIAGTDCGFDTSAGAGRVAEDVVWAKLRAMRDGARLASDRLL